MLNSDLVQRLCFYFEVGPSEDLRCVMTGARAFPYPLYPEGQVSPSFANYIPLSPALGEMLESNDEPDRILDHANVLDKYRSHLLAWRPAYAYACARLAVHLYNRPSHRGRHLSQVVDWAANALYCVRGKYHPDLVESTVNYDILWKPEGKITPSYGQRLSLEVAAYWNEYGHLEAASEWLSLAKRFETASRQTSDEELARRSSNMLRREAQILLHTTPNDARVQQILDLATDLLPTGRISFATTRANMHVMRSILLADDFNASAKTFDFLFSQHASVFPETGIAGKRVGGLSAASAGELYFFSGIIRACAYADTSAAEARIRVALSLMDSSGYRLPLYIWRHILNLSYKNPDYACRIREIAEKYANAFDVPPSLATSFRRLYAWLEAAIPERVLMQNTFNINQVQQIVTAENSTVNTSWGLTSERLHQVNELLALVGDTLNAGSCFKSEDKLALSEAAQLVRESVHADAPTPSRLRQSLSVFKETATAIVAKMAVDTTASVLSGKLTQLVHYASELMHQLSL